MQIWSFSLMFLSLGLALLGCTRPQGEITRISFQVPNQSLVALPDGKKACYGVNIQGPGISDTAFGSCGATVGSYAGFVESGMSVSLNVNKGSGRTVQILMVLVDASGTCPNIDGTFIASASSPSITYVGATQTGVNLTNDQTDLTMTAVFPGLASSVAASSGSCGGAAGLKAMLYSNGDLGDVSGTSLTTQSSPLNESFYSTNYADPLGIGVITSGGVINLLTAGTATVPEFVYSVTRKPDTGKTYGLTQDGKIVELTFAAGVGSVTELGAGTCPFAVSNCEVPVWMQSISAGYGTKLYSLDHAGTIYSLEASGPTDTGVSVAPTVSQVSYY
jgi:hypothetical protein